MDKKDENYVYYLVSQNLKKQRKLKKLQSVYEDNSAIYCCHIEFRKLEHDKT